MRISHWNTGQQIITNYTKTCMRLANKKVAHADSSTISTQDMNTKKTYLHALEKKLQHIASSNELANVWFDSFRQPAQDVQCGNHEVLVRDFKLLRTCLSHLKVNKQTTPKCTRHTVWDQKCQRALNEVEELHISRWAPDISPMSTSSGPEQLRTDNTEALGISTTYRPGEKDCCCSKYRKWMMRETERKLKGAVDSQ